jgi:hypothetical protein
MRRLALCLSLALLPLASLAQEEAPLSAFAQEDGGTGAPDASVGNGGADRDNEEGDDHTGRVVISCRSSRDCSPRFSCSEGTCRYSGIREAERVGCMLGPQAALVVMGLTLVGAWRRKKE